MDCAKAISDGDLKFADFLSEKMEFLSAAEIRLHLFATIATNFNIFQTLKDQNHSTIHWLLHGPNLQRLDVILRKTCLLLKIIPDDQYQTKTIKTRWSAVLRHSPTQLKHL